MSAIQRVDGRAITSVNPASGEVISLTDRRADALVLELDRVADLEDRLDEHKRAIRDELAARADRRGARTVELDGVKLEVNAPTEELYDVRRLRAELEELVRAGVIDRELVGSIIVHPKPKIPDPRVDKRMVNALKRSDDRRVIAALQAARTVSAATRTVKILERPVDTDGEEV